MVETVRSAATTDAIANATVETLEIHDDIVGVVSVTFKEKILTKYLFKIKRKITK